MSIGNRTVGYSNVTKSLIGWVVVIVLVVILFLGWIPAQSIFKKFDSYYNTTVLSHLNGTAAIAASQNARNMNNGASNTILYGYALILIVVGLLYAQSRERYTGVYR